MAKKLASKLEAHHTAFIKKLVEDGSIDYAPWFLSLVVFPSLKDIAERIDAIEASRRKGTDDEH